jgi:four helix bundle protein
MAIAGGSASETEYLLLLAQGLGYLKEETYEELNEKVIEIKRMLNGFHQFLKLNR